MPAVEEIPIGDEISRHIEFPRTYDRERRMILEAVFEFPGGEPESVVWRKYAATDDEVHKLGCEWETKSASVNLR